MALVKNKPTMLSFLRNGTLCNSREEAIEGLKKAAKLNDQDGILILARYKENKDIKTLLGVLYSKDETKSITVFGSNETISLDEEEKKSNLCYEDIYMLYYDLNEINNKLR